MNNLVFLYLIPEHRHLLLCQIHPSHYNAGGTTLSQVPTLQRPLLLQEFLASPQVTIAFVAFCTIGSTCALLPLGS